MSKWLVIVEFYNLDEEVYGTPEYAVFDSRDDAVAFVARQEAAYYVDALNRDECSCEIVEVENNPLGTF